MGYVIDWRTSPRYEALPPWTRFMTILIDKEVFEDSPFDVAVVEYPVGAKCPEHLHKEAVELYFVLKGEITTTIEGVPYRICENNLMYVPAGKMHQAQNTGSKPCIFIAVHTPPEERELNMVKRTWKKSSV